MLVVARVALLPRWETHAWERPHSSTATLAGWQARPGLLTRQGGVRVLLLGPPHVLLCRGEGTKRIACACSKCTLCTSMHPPCCSCSTVYRCHQQELMRRSPKPAARTRSGSYLQLRRTFGNHRRHSSPTVDTSTILQQQHTWRHAELSSTCHGAGHGAPTLVLMNRPQQSQTAHATDRSMLAQTMQPPAPAHR